MPGDVWRGEGDTHRLTSAGIRLPQTTAAAYNDAMHRSVRIIFVAALSVAILAAPALAAPVRVRATSNNTWSPFEQHSSPGQRVVWKNPTGRRHSVTAFGGNWSKDTVIRAGERTRKVFRRTGTYRYRCRFHSHLDGTECHGMCGQIHVMR